jgi:hypothetical protein
MQWANWFIAPEGVATLESYYQLVRLVRLADLDCDDDDDEDGLTEGSVLFSSRFRLGMVPHSTVCCLQALSTTHSFGRHFKTPTCFTSFPHVPLRSFQAWNDLSLTKERSWKLHNLLLFFFEQSAAWRWYTYIRAREQSSCISEWAGYPSGCVQKVAHRAVQCFTPVVCWSA